MLRPRFVPLLLLLLLLAPGRAESQGQAEYTLGPEDVVQVQVVGRADLSGQVAVDLDGKLRVPAIGDITAADRTPTDLSKELKQRFRILDPAISEVLISVTQYNSRSVTVVGEVRNPGRYGFRFIPNLWDVLLGAGGPTPNADMGRVEIVPREPSEGQPRIVRVDLSRGIEGTDPATLPVLRPKDTINVPSQAAGAVPTGDTFQVIGSVRTPGIYSLSKAQTLVEALALSGGPLPEANLDKVQLTRSTPQGVVAYRIDLQSHLFEGKPAGDLALRPGDTLTVPGKKTSVTGLVTTVLPLITAFASLLVSYEVLKRD